MNITFTPEVEQMIAKLASQQGMEVEAYAERVIRKHTIAQIRNQALEELVSLPFLEVKALSESISAKFEEHKPKPAPVVEEEPVEEIMKK